jgi:hypothetical protein
LDRTPLDILKDDKTQLVISLVLMVLGVLVSARKTQHLGSIVSIAIGCFAITIWAWRNKGDWPMRGASAFNYFACAGFFWFHR